MSTTTQPALPEITLPTEKSTPGLSIATSRSWIYGEAGVGKTTLATEMGDEPLLIATDPGYRHLSVMAQPVGDWLTFRAVTKSVAESDRFDLLVVDTVETLYRHCRDDRMAALGISHPSDLDFGKGWDAVNGEFQTRIAKLCSLGRGVVFISHQRDDEVKGFTPYTKSGPNLSGAATKWLGGFVDYIMQATVEEGEGGVRYLLRTEPVKERVAKQRVVPGGSRLPDPIERPADDPAGPLKAAIAAANPQPEAAQS